MPSHRAGTPGVLPSPTPSAAPGRPRPGRRARRRRALAGTLVAAALLAAGPTAAQGAPEEGAGTAAAQAQAAFLAAEVDAARSRQLYLVLDGAASVLEVRAEGLTLLTLPLDRAEVLHPPGAPVLHWAAPAFRLEGAPPPIVRPDLTPPPPGTVAVTPPAAPAQPGAPLDFRARQRRELLERAPASYLLRFVPIGAAEPEAGDGEPVEPAVPGIGAPVLEVAVEGDGAAAPGTGGWRGGWRHLAARFGGPRPADRLRLELPADAARRLALALQADVRLLLAPPPPTADPVKAR